MNGWFPGFPEGNPAMPNPTYMMNLSTAMWFVGNDTGMNNEIELNAEAQYGAIGIGWEINNKNSNYTNADEWIEQTAISLKKLNQNLLTLAPRNTECIGIIWNIARNAINNNKKDLFLTDPNNNNEIYLFKWQGEGYSFDAAYLNFLNNNSINYWITNWIEPIIKNNNFDGLYWDHCDQPPSNILNQQQLNE